MIQAADIERMSLKEFRKGLLHRHENGTSYGANSARNACRVRRPRQTYFATAPRAVRSARAPTAAAEAAALPYAEQVRMGIGRPAANCQPRQFVVPLRELRADPWIGR